MRRGVCRRTRHQCGDIVNLEFGFVPRTVHTVLLSATDSTQLGHVLPREWCTKNGLALLLLGVMGVGKGIWIGADTGAGVRCESSMPSLSRSPDLDLDVDADADGGRVDVGSHTG